MSNSNADADAMLSSAMIHRVLYEPTPHHPVPAWPDRLLLSLFHAPFDDPICQEGTVQNENMLNSASSGRPITPATALVRIRRPLPAASPPFYLPKASALRAERRRARCEAWEAS
jgi:hypothetical protein